MVNVSELLIARKDVESFDQLVELMREAARQGERFLKLDIKPPYPDTPEDWQDQLESAFNGRV